MPYATVSRCLLGVPMSNEILAVLMPLGFTVMLLIGIPVGISLFAAGLLFGYFGFGMEFFGLLPIRIYGVVTNYTLMAIPLFVFMGVMLEKSKLADELLDVIGHLCGPLPGGMALAIILVGILMGASTGIVGATVVTLGLLTLPVLLRRGYDKRLASGVICASGTLGQIIPPSLVLILLADILGQSVGTMFAAALFPGLMLGGLYLLYVFGLSAWKPSLAPPIPRAERAGMSGVELLGKTFKVLVPPFALIAAVLGSIIGGVAAPTAAASLGALGSILVTLVAGRLTLPVLTETLLGTLKISCMVFFILFGAQAFSLAFRGLNGDDLVLGMFDLVPGDQTMKLAFLMILLFLLGFFLEWIEICYIAIPLFLPVFEQYNVDWVWLAAVICVNLQTSFLTPPVGWALFFFRGVAPPEITTADIYRGIVPFVAMQLIGLVILFFFPQIATWLPKAIGW